MPIWWYSEKEKKVGPVDADELTRLLQTGKIGPETMLWKEGLESWKPLDEIDELQAVRAALPPPLPPKVSADPLSYPLATRWPRFFARIFDVWWEVLLVSFVLGAVLGRYSAGFVEWINGPGVGQIFAILSLPVALTMDAFVYRVLGNTPGKALLGLKVGTLDAKPLGLSQYLGRNFSLWASGLALGFPLFNLFTMANQSRRLGKGQQTSYDEPTGYRVRAKPIGIVRKISFGFAFTGVLGGMIALNSMEQAAQREAVLSTTSKNYYWENPITRVNATIDSRWKNSSQANTDGQQIYMFSERTDRAAVILGVEYAAGYTLDDYVRAFQKGTAATMRFSDGGRFLERGGRSVWSGDGSMINSTSNHLRVQIVQIDSAFWRIVTIQAMPYDYSDVLVQQLQAALWSTVL